MERVALPSGDEPREGLVLGFGSDSFGVEHERVKLGWIRSKFCRMVPGPFTVSASFAFYGTVLPR